MKRNGRSRSGVTAKRRRARIARRLARAADRWRYPIGVRGTCASCGGEDHPLFAKASDPRPICIRCCETDGKPQPVPVIERQPRNAREALAKCGFLDHVRLIRLFGDERGIADAIRRRLLPPLGEIGIEPLKV